MAKNCKELNCQTPELQVYFNDLPGNDFNTLFKGLSEFGGGDDRCDGVSCYGMLDEVKLDSFNVPYYIPSAKEVQDVVERQGSFKIENIDTIAVNNVGKGLDNGDVWVRGEIFGKHVRVFTESMISNQFGEEVLDKIYEKSTRIALSDWVGTQSTGATTIVVVLSKIAG
ncbi:putative caffeine synthase 2 [Camellia lanceoleosa]|uniref:Caffeine synthase 2 n=1 Tax=Camellia lanceoleosa TaxID=1840588 RepID=A0ACC0J2L6_9ERIC|nr:putative caffeine synthase 2 [Camellia lanceoleosa]